MTSNPVVRRRLLGTSESNPNRFPRMIFGVISFRAGLSSIIRKHAENYDFNEGICAKNCCSFMLTITSEVLTRGSENSCYKTELRVVTLHIDLGTRKSYTSKV